MEHESLIESIKAELADAENSRRLGKEGRARVSARRASGWAIQYYIEDLLGESTKLNAYQLLGWFAGREDVSQDLRQAASRLRVRVTPAGVLPHPQDALQDAHAIVDALLHRQV